MRPGNGADAGRAPASTEPSGPVGAAVSSPSAQEKEQATADENDGERKEHHRRARPASWGHAGAAPKRPNASATSSARWYVSSLDGNRPARTSSANRATAVGGVGLQRRVAADELRLDAVLEAEQVVVHEHLAVAVTPGADADRRHGHRVGDDPGDGVGHALEHDREAARLGERHGVVDDGLGGVELLALHLEAADGVDGLGREAEVAHHRDLGVEDRLDGAEALAAALELHRRRAGADELGRVADRLLGGDVVAEPRQVTDEQGPGLGPGGGRDMVGHVVDRDLERVLVAEDDHGQRVADQDHVDPGGVGDPGRREVVGGHHHQGRPVALAGADVGRARAALACRGSTTQSSSPNLHRPGHPRLPAASRA